MTIHICRDFNNYSNDIATYNFVHYAVAIFCRAVLGWTIVGNTNMPLGTVGSWLIVEGTGASINQGSEDEWAVAIPVGQHVVSSSDINRTLVLISSSNPRKNSGLFHVINVDIANNYLYIDYRSPDFPPVETGMSWSLYANETSVAYFNGDNNAGGGEYETQGAATANRVILETPGGWQVRLSREGTTDSTNFTCDVSVAVGIGGDIAGDFSQYGEHTHIGQYWNRSTDDYSHVVVGAGSNTATPNRIYIWGDTTTETVVCIWRDAGSGHDGILVFGLTEDEEEPIPTKIVQRLFVIGTSEDNQHLGLDFGFMSPTGDQIGGNAFGLSNRPVSCVLSQYTSMYTGNGEYFNATFDGAPYFHTTRRDNNFTKQTELLHTEVIAGSWDAMDFSGQDPAIPIEVRRIGTCPLLRMGRSNLGDFQMSNPNDSWIHTKNGIYLPWSGPQVLP